MRKARAGTHVFVLFGLTVILFSQTLFSQVSNTVTDRHLTTEYEYLTSNKEISFHSSVKPFLRTELLQWVNLDSLEKKRDLLGKLNRSATDSAEKKPGRGTAEVHPLFFLQTGYENADTLRQNISGSAIGASVSIAYRDKFFLNTNFITANTALPSFVSHYTDSMKIIPGEGLSFDTKLGHHYKNFSGYVSYSPSPIFNFQVGHGKNFIGDGYRSLLLSDVANNYSFAKISTKIWKIKYVNIFADFKDIRNGGTDYNSFTNKYGTFHYLSWNLAKWFNLGLFESVIWQGKDTLNKRGYDVNYLNPVIFYRPVEYSLGSSDNSLMGLNFRFKITHKIQLYSQLVIDEFLLKEVRARSGWWANKYGGQLGVKYFDAFGLKGFSVQAELNEVRPYTYSHGSSLQNYAHFNQPLAHPLGANFSEVIGILHYGKNRFGAELKIVVSKYGADSAGNNYGGDLFKSYNNVPSQYGNKTGQGIASYLLVNEMNLSYLLVPDVNLRAEAGMLFREKYFSDELTSNVFFWVGIKTSLYSIYRDFI